MTNNFDFLKYFPNEKLLAHMQEIEEKINSDDYSFSSELAKIIEMALKTPLKQFIRKSDMKVLKRDDLNLNELFQCVGYEYKNTKDQQGINANIRLAFNHIRIARNDKVHDSSTNLYSFSRLNFNQKINLLRQAHIVLIFIFNNWFNTSSRQINVNDFDDLVYFKKYKVIKNIEDELMTKDHSNGNDDNLIHIFKKYIGDLILSPKIGFQIPPYQRNYVWSTNHVGDLLNSIFENYEKNSESQFFGTIAITSEKNEDDEFLFKLIDGQQRITTSLLILKAIYNRMLEISPVQIPAVKALPRDLELQFKRDENGNYPNSLLIKINKKNDYLEEEIELRAFNKLMKIFNPKEALNSCINEQGTNIIKNYSFIAKFLEDKFKYSYFELEEFYKYFTTKYVLAVIDFKKNANQEMEIFENLNSKGMELGILDLIKNSIFLNIDPEIFLEHEQEIVRTFASTIDLKYKIILENPKIIKNKRREEEIEKWEKDFFYDYIAFVTKNLDHKIETKNLLKNFNKVINNKKINNLQNFKIFSNKIGKYVQIFLDIIVFKKYENQSYFIHDLSTELNLFNDKKALMPILYYLWDIYVEENGAGNTLRFSIKPENKKYLQKSLLEIEKWSVAVVQARGGQSQMKAIIDLIKFFGNKDLDSNFKFLLPTYIRDWLAGKSGGDNENINNSPKINSDSQTPSHQEFFDALTNKPIKKPLQETLVKRIEMHAFTRGRNDQEMFWKRGSIEHIIPQKIKNTIWLKNSINDDNNEEEILAKHEEKKDMLGNLLWMPQSANSSVSNKDFQTKKNCYIKNDICAAKLKISSTSNSTLLDLEKFDYSDLTNRTKMMAYLIMELYDYRR